MPSRRVRGLIRLGIALAAATVLVVIIARSNDSELIIFGSTPSYPHQVQIVAPSAFEAEPGERVVEGGEGIGTILQATVTARGRAHLVLGLSNAAWPVPVDSTFTLRMGGTVKFTDRYISIAPGHSRQDLAENAIVPSRQFVVPVEYDQLFNTFNAPTRAALREFFDVAGPDMAAAAPGFRRAVGVAGPMLAQGAAVFSDLGYDQQALSSLVSSTATLSDAVASANPGLRTLLSGAAQTFGTLASQSTQLQQAISAAGPTALRDVSITLHHAAQVLPLVATLSRRLAPGVTQLQRDASPLNGTLHELVTVEPSAVHTLGAIERAGPTVHQFLVQARATLMPELTKVGNEAVPELDCIRPYTPDIMGLMQTWGAFWATGLNHPHIGLLHSEAGLNPSVSGMPLDSSQFLAAFPQIKIAFPQPPGMAWAQPWYQPQCGVTPAAMNPARDPEAHTYDPNGSMLVPYGPTTTPTFGNGRR